MGLLALTLTTGPAFAEHVYEATLTGDQEVNPSGSTAYGTATLILNPDTNMVAYTVNFAGLDAPQTGAGFFVGAAGTVGTEVMTLPLGSPLSGMWELDAETKAALMDEALYINIFSDSEMFPDGEIRGNFDLTIVSEDGVSLGQVKALYR
jgi:hypothetical protein